MMLTSRFQSQCFAEFRYEGISQAEEFVGAFVGIFLREYLKFKSKLK